MFDLLKTVANAGRALGFGDKEDTEANREIVEKELRGTGLDGADKVGVEVAGDTIVLKGDGVSQEVKEKLMMAAANIKGVAAVQDKLAPADKSAAGQFHTVVSGDTLGAIAQKYLGKASAYPVIFEANKPMLDNPDRIYPGQLLRIPAK
ncbi:MAG: peptidoglycan-binding protein LysM [Pseudomonadota bacterium]